MDWNQLEQLRVNGFTLARRGYDTREVDKFLHMLADWLETDAATELGDQAVQRKLELVGKSTAHILLTTEQEAQELRRTTQAECAELRQQAEVDSARVRQEAEEYAVAMREESDKEARKTIEEGERRRAAIEAVVADLEAQRDATVADLERLRGELLTTITKHSTRTAPEERSSEGRRKRANTEKTEEAEVTS